MTPQWAPARLVALDGAVNVRDVGGYQSSYGLQVMRGRLFRGDSLSQLSGLDVERVDRLGLYHCSGGKDRTGWMTAIVLTMLGVPREVVLRDYLLSNDFHRTGYQKLRFDLRPGATRAGAVSARSDPVSLCGGAARGGASGPRRAAQR